MPIYRRLPKRGFNNIFGKDLNIVSVGRRAGGDRRKANWTPRRRLTAVALKEAGVIRREK